MMNIKYFFGLLGAFVCLTAFATPLEDGLEAYKNKDYDLAYKLLEPYAKNGNPEAQKNLGNMYTLGLGTEKNLIEALSWTTLAANKNFAPAQNNLGIMYRDGLGVPRNIPVAIEWFKKSAAQGLVNAQYNLGLLYHRGEYVPVDMPEAIKWYKLAVSQGYPNAQYALGYIYINGNEVQKNISEGIRLWKLAANQGFQMAKDALHKGYVAGEGNLPDEGAFKFQFSDEKSDICKDEWRIGNLTLKDKEEDICWKNTPQKIEIKTLRVFSNRTFTIDKPAALGTRDLSPETAQFFSSSSDKTRSEKFNVAFEGYPIYNIKLILDSMPQNEWSNFCSRADVLSEIKIRLKEVKKVNAIFIQPQKTLSASSGILSQYSCDVNLTLADKKQVSGVVSIKLNKDKKDVLVGWTPTGSELDKNDPRYGAKGLIKITAKDIARQQSCIEERAFTTSLAAMKRNYLPYKVTQEWAATYDQIELQRDNALGAQSGSPVRRIRDPLSAINLERSRLDLVDFAYKNDNVYENYPNGLVGYIYDKCVAGDQIESENTHSTKDSMSLEQARVKCLNLGFKSGTESFGQCVLKVSK